MIKDLLMHRMIVFWELRLIFVALFFVFFPLFLTSSNAQLQFNITDGQVAPTPIAIADFTNLDGEVSNSGRQIAEIISNDLISH